MVDFYGTMYPAYVRGEAFLAEGNGVEAAAEFQKLIDHQVLGLASTGRPHRGAVAAEIAKAWAMARDSAAKAKGCNYQDFITLPGEGADSESPILRSATAEFKKTPMSPSCGKSEDPGQKTLEKPRIGFRPSGRGHSETRGSGRRVELSVH